MNNTQYLYTYSFHHDEDELYLMEMRAFFGTDSTTGVIISPVKINPSRSPFMNLRMDVQHVADSFEALEQYVATLDLGEQSFRIDCLNDEQYNTTQKIAHQQRRQMERALGMAMVGMAELDNPDIRFGMISYDAKWYFGPITMSESIWRHHVKKPHMYSTALSTRVSRAVANIAVPFIEGVRAIDPCCGIGTVLVEARSMGIDIVGRDMNQLVVYGSRKNLRHFNYPDQVDIGPIAEVEGEYDVTIIDMPYNLFTNISRDEQADIIMQARRFTKKIVIITIESMDDMIEAAGFKVIDRCLAKKGTFSREILLCE